MYTWDFKQFVIDYLNTVVRKAKHIALLYSLAKPIEFLYADFLAYKTQTDLLVRYSGQTKSLEVLLNSIFDSTLNRIYITTDGDAISLYTYYRTERASFYTTNRSEAGYQPKFLSFRSEDVTLTNDFIVHAPASIVSTKSTEVNSWVNRYKIAGKTHTLQSI